ncbi:telomerase RNA component interacting RNase-like [Macrosteles quadrilineatus]|uniref:telomerase RNA component interacting RNase-like n=1 Tax=Macrosteles quadrilineatus TaxID=74068 RepID=UPI0023E1D32F|nr:telomerase RNA component interacting RNase-like [Macrosteles quadrilineatus]
MGIKIITRLPCVRLMGGSAVFLGEVRMVYHRSTERSSGSSHRPANVFANDGSFMEMFKKMQEQQSSQSSSSSADSDGNKQKESSSSTSLKVKEGTSVSDSKDTSSSSEGKTAQPASKPLFVGKRRGGRFLATGKVKKLKVEGTEEEEAPPKDAWSLYLAEVKKYKQTTCEEEGKTRPLVK